MGAGLGQISQAYGDVAGQAANFSKGISQVGQGLSGLTDKYPDLKNDQQFIQAQGALKELQAGAEGLHAGLLQLNGKLSGVAGGMEQANTGFAQAADGQAQLAQGLAAIVEGIGKLQSGITQAANGQNQIVGKLPELTSGFDQLVDGQKELQTGFAQLNGQLGQLTSGLDQSVGGLTQVSDGLKSAKTYLNELSSSPDKQMTGWFIPDEALANPDFQASIDVYLSKDRKIAKFDVVYEGNPYAIETLKKTNDVNDAVTRGLKGTKLEQAQIAVSGISSVNNDLRQISSDDYARTVVLMLIGIAVILIIMFRSIVIPVYLIISLVITYYTSLAITEVIFVRMLGYSGVSWAVPFFGFVLLMALGVDYSIFLMDRFKEYKHLSPREAILQAMKSMGTVIMSAALILGGTFAAMLPSGVMSLMQIATIVLSGLVIYALVMLPLFVPVMVRTFGEANWWPFMRRKEVKESKESKESKETPRKEARPISGEASNPSI
ncbi:putative membrane protein YdgH [compost metagenome]